VAFRVGAWPGVCDKFVASLSSISVSQPPVRADPSRHLRTGPLRLGSAQASRRRDHIAPPQDERQGLAAVSKRVASAQIAARVRAARMRSALRPFDRAQGRLGSGQALRDAAWEEGRSSGQTGLKRSGGMSSDSTGTVRSMRIHKVRGTFPTNMTRTPRSCRR